MRMYKTDHLIVFPARAGVIPDDVVITGVSISIPRASVYSCAGVPLFRRNGNRQSDGRKPLNRNRDTALKCLLPASLLA